MLDYTSIYRKIYSAIQRDDLPHEQTHSASLKISNALSDIYLFTQEQPPEITDIIIGTLEDFGLKKSTN